MTTTHTASREEKEKKPPTDYRAKDRSGLCFGVVPRSSFIGWQGSSRRYSPTVAHMAALTIIQGGEGESMYSYVCVDSKFCLHRAILPRRRFSMIRVSALLLQCNAKSASTASPFFSGIASVLAALVRCLLKLPLTLTATSFGLKFLPSTLPDGIDN